VEAGAVCKPEVGVLNKPPLVLPVDPCSFVPQPQPVADKAGIAVLVVHSTLDRVRNKSVVVVEEEANKKFASIIGQLICLPLLLHWDLKMFVTHDPMNSRTLDQSPHKPEPLNMLSSSPFIKAQAIDNYLKQIPFSTYRR
jgi:hypothetical protein